MRLALGVQDGDLCLLLSVPPTVLLLQLLESTRPSVGHLVAAHRLQHLGRLIDFASRLHHTVKAWGVAKGHEHAVSPVRSLRNQVITHVLTDGGSVLFSSSFSVCELAAWPLVVPVLPVNNDLVTKLHHQGAPSSVGAEVISVSGCHIVASLLSESACSRVQRRSDGCGDGHRNLSRLRFVVFAGQVEIQPLRLHRVTISCTASPAVASQPTCVHRAAVIDQAQS